ncbi:MAG: hypothetical protein K9N51_10400, partial [Candidatus Pacebacteria bacterium]|nr:hypothetical protein [Candidatus Paceibacterota bacterium]
MTESTNLLQALNSFDEATRCKSLKKLVEQNPEKPPEKPWVNMHMHSFFSFNGEGYSPSRLAWEARQTGLYAMGLCDFDVLTALPELFFASDL